MVGGWMLWVLEEEQRQTATFELVCEGETL